MPENQSFRWISAEPANTEYITVDAMQRLYLSSGAADLLAIADWPASVFVGYDHVNKRIVVGKAGVVRPADVKPFKFDKRRYAYAKPFVKAIGVIEPQLPLRFVYVGRDHSVGVPQGAFAFQLSEYAAPDEPK